MKLSKPLAKRIAQEMMSVIPFNINVMDERGMITGSGDPGRIDTLHRGARIAIESGTIFEVYEEADGMKPGVNEPILLDGEIIGVVGITGNPDIVRPFSKLVRATTVLLIEQERQNKRDQDEREHRAQFFHELSYRNIPYDQDFLERASRYQLDLTRKSRVLVAEGALNGKDFLAIVHSLPSWWVVEEQRAILFLTDSALFRKLTERLSACRDVLRLGIGSEEALAAQSLAHATLAMRTGASLDPFAKVYSYERLKFLIHLSYSGKESPESLYSLLDQSGDKTGLIETLQVYLAENGDHNRTVARLNIHRNTLNYRLGRIERLTGKNPREFVDLFELMCGLIWRDGTP